MNQSEVNQKDEELLHGRFTGSKNFSNFPRLRLRRNVGICSNTFLIHKNKNYVKKMENYIEKLQQLCYNDKVQP